MTQNMRIGMPVSISGNGISSVITGIQSTELTIENSEIASLISGIIRIPGKLQTLLVEDIKPHKDSSGNIPTTVLDLIKTGTPFMDALLYCAMETSDRTNCHAVAYSEPIAGASAELYSKAVFVMVLIMMIRGSYPRASDEQVVPKFITNTVGWTYDYEKTLKMISSFDIQKLGTDWIKSLGFGGLNVKVITRLGIGMAGFRLPSVFRYYDPSNANTLYAANKAKVDNAIAVIIHLLQQSPNWEMHPLTRSARFANHFKTFNKALIDLMGHCFTEDQLKDMKGNNFVHQTFSFTISRKYRNWVNWTKFNLDQAQIINFTTTGE